MDLQLDYVRPAAGIVLWAWAVRGSGSGGVPRAPRLLLPVVGLWAERRNFEASGIP